LEDQRDGAVLLDLNRCIGALTTSLSNKLSSGASQEYRASFDIGVVEWRILSQLGAEPWLTGAQLSHSIGLDKASISRGLRVLEDRGLIETRSAGGRRQEANLTRKGWAMHGRVLAVALARERCLLEGFTDSEVDSLVGLLHRLLANLPNIEADALRRASPPRKRARAAQVQEIAEAAE
jgi:DNA-binding MarR family transcriptional regulator